MEIQYLLFVLLGFSASIISSVFGFGTALVVLAVGAHILPASEAIALATVLFTASTVFKTILLRDHIDWKMVGTMTVASLPFAYLGANLLSHIPTDMLQRLLGIMVLGYLLLSRIKHTPKVRPGTVNLIAASATYGFISGLLGSGSIVKAIVFTEMRLHKAAFVGVMAATAVMANIAKLAVFIQSGLLSNKHVGPISGLILAAVAAAILGQRMLQHVSLSNFELGLKLVLAVSALALLV